MHTNDQWGLDIASADDAYSAPSSVAPLAADIDPSFEAGGTNRGRSVARIAGVVATYAVLMIVGASAGAYGAAPVEVRAKVSAMQAKVSRKSQPAAAAAAAPAAPAAAPVAVVTPATPSPAPAPSPVVAASAPPAGTEKGLSIDSLPSAKPIALSNRSKRRSR